MTSEVLTMNKSAIAMAADSAVTVNGSKTYNGVNKLFMLSQDNPPMGMMIYGSADFEKIPMETLIKEYRKRTDFEEKDIISIKDDFLEFLGKNTPNSDFESMIESGLELFKPLIVRQMENYEGSLVDFLKSRVTQDLPDFLNDYNQIIKQYDNEFEEIIPDYVEDEHHDEIVTLLKNIFFNYLMRMGTGIVISGFNTQDLFPSVVKFNICLNNSGKIEIVDYEELINYDGSGIFPFAQKDVINTFLTGIDSTMENAIVELFSNFLDNHLEKIRVEFNSNDEIKNNYLSLVNQILDNFSMSSDIGVEEFIRDIAKLKDNYAYPILNSVAVLPKEELANMVESLIRITSLKRKMDSNLETVGGDIDVSIISKGDGYIWKKKKHYFDVELNPQFFNKNK
ncbi:hypothetical protein [Methanobrevibacter millerae]|uniref:Uncharacterized protein n=1 Tax=Methanobrevibacter millerae TaxID=230361 RepID=A0A1G5WX77_9EURY|nr:hypothetical protein [Methanobrevibacter millerae]SDA62733.1 hypothetical protein SAMN02910315_01777 [Methanobrevibacter millerae]